jgi:hypothetical protein
MNAQKIREWKRNGAVRLAAVGVGLVLTQACAQPEFDHLEVEQRSSVPAPVDARDDLIEVPIGIAMRVKVKPVAKGSNRYSANDDLEFETDNASVMDAFQVEDTSQVVVTGVRVGRSCLRVIVNDVQVACLDVEVVDQDVDN